MKKLQLVLVAALFAWSSVASAATGEATVRAVWYAKRDGKPTGGTSPVRVRIADNPGGQLTIGIAEEYLGGAGDQWRGAAWLAAFNASQAAGVPLSAHEFFVISGGHIDGPSAGMLMTSTMLALLRGVPVRPDTTMTGTVNPDGSAGPVGGIPQKMLGAKAAGIKRFGFPMGNRMSVDLRTGKKVDLVRFGKRIGVQAVEVHDLWEAYELLTGRKAERPTPAPRATMGLPKSLTTRLQGRVKAWDASTDKLLATIRADLARLPESVRASVWPILQEAQKEFRAVGRFSKAGYYATALEKLIVGWTVLRVAMVSARYSKYALASDWKGLVDFAAHERDAVEADIGKLAAEAGERRPGRSLSGTVNASTAISDWARAQAFLGLAKEQLVASQRDLQKKGTLDVTKIGEALSQLAVARGMVALGRERLGLLPVRKDGAPSTERLQSLARAYGSMGNAALGYFDALILDDTAREKNVQTSAVRRAAAEQYVEYRIGRVTANLAGKAGRLVRDRPTADALLFELGAGTEAYLEGAALVNKFYSLGGRKDASGAWRLREQKSLKHQLELARSRALAAAGRARTKTGRVPVSARWYFELGEAERNARDDDAKLDALNAYWTSSLLSELSVSLAR